MNETSCRLDEMLQTINSLSPGRLLFTTSCLMKPFGCQLNEMFPEYKTKMKFTDGISQLNPLCPITPRSH